MTADEQREVWADLIGRITDLACLLDELAETPCDDQQSMAVDRALAGLDEAWSRFGSVVHVRLVGSWAAERARLAGV